MWKVLFESACGTSHAQSGQPCQDFAGAKTIFADGEDVLIAACSDGAGTAKFADVASQLVVSGIIEEVSAAVIDGSGILKVTQQLVRQWYINVRSRLERESNDRRSSIRDFACTLLLAVVGARNAVFAQIGDGAIVIDGPGSYQAVFWPQSGEYANTTNFLCDDSFVERIEVTISDTVPNEVALLTDGLQMIALSYALRQAHSPFFAPMFQVLAQTEYIESLGEPLRSFLGSEEVLKRTDDDKTLVLATRVPPQ